MHFLSTSTSIDQLSICIKRTPTLSLINKQQQNKKNNNKQQQDYLLSMGNSLLCSLRHPNLRTALLFDTQGHLRIVELPAKAAELMIEAPHSVVCPVDELRKSRAIWALRADENLQPGKFYLMFPSNRVYCKASEVEMKLINAAFRKKGRTPGPQVFPTTITVEEEEDKQGVLVLGEDHHATGFTSCRSSSISKWRPILHPIYEAS